MARREVPYDYRLSDTLAVLRNPGLLLLGTKSTGQSNVMTIGWGTAGIIWGRPIFIVMVRPSRYTYEFIEEAQAFTVNVPTDEMRSWVGICGSRSGRDIDKLGAYEMTVTSCETICSATIDASPMVYECRVVHHNDVIPAHLDAQIERSSYRGSDYHRIYFGELVGTYADEGY